ncbi:polysaccharide pyruvyl transferase family protein [Haemophilus haemoglobinophilus]|nr:polysaccharide pyruvyl transferase family protein [Canicola haemoglobinophilus]
MNNILLELKNKLAVINDLIVDKNDVFYFDYPLHLNVGDLLIYHGTKQFFADNQINIRLERSVRSFSLSEAKKLITPNTTILCHGGGNFGDLYRVCQRLRETLIKEFPNNRIIVMPQSVHFSTNEKLNLSAQIFKTHSDCHLFARDTKSEELMKKFSDNVYLSPDMAHQLYGSLAKYQKNNNPILYFMRRDAEKIDNNISVQDKTKDWGDIVSNGERNLANLLWLISEITRRTGLYFINNWINKFWFSYTKKIVQRSEKEFLSYSKVITDRLHGHIFSCLLEIPNEVKDNLYGKNSGYYNAWTKDLKF